MGKIPSINDFLKQSPPGGELERQVIAVSIIAAVVVAIIDHVTKAAVVSSFRLHESIPVIPDFFHLTYVTNKGAAWGMLHGQKLLLLAISAVVFVMVIWKLRTLTEGWNERFLAMGLILGGVIGNSIDRLWRGEVVDFLDFFHKSYHFPAFNVADIGITCGVAIYIASVLFRPNQKQRDADSGNPPTEQ